MLIKKDINFLNLIDQVGKCNKDVFFCTADGDRLNLKSELSKVVFVTILGHDDLLKNSAIECVDENDYEVLKNFIEK